MNKKIIVGCVQLGLKYGIANKSKIKNLELKKIFNFCKKNNILKFDTSLNYGNIDQKIIRYFSKENIKIYTKVDKSNFEKFKKIYKNNTSKIECIYFHNLNDFLDKKFRNKILSYKKEFKIKKIGLSIYEKQELKYLNKDINVVQIPINILNRNFDNDRIKKILNRKKIEINARSIFQQGLFRINQKKLRKNFYELYEPIKLIRKLSKKNNLNTFELSLSYVNSLRFINNLIIGFNSLNQLKQNIKSLQKKPPKNLINFIKINNFNKLEKVNIHKW